MEIDEGLLHRIISVAYGDAGFLEKLRIYLLASRNSEVKKLLNDFKKTSDAIHTLEQDECPAEILDKVKISTGLDKNVSSRSSFNFFYPLFYKPVLTVITILVFISGIVFFLLINNTNENSYSKSQIQLAEKQVKQSLVLVNRVFNRTADTIENDVLKEQVAKPVHEGISTINNLFNGG